MAGTPHMRPAEAALAAAADAAVTRTHSIWVRGVPAAALSDCLKQTETAFEQWNATYCKVCASLIFRAHGPAVPAWTKRLVTG